MAAAEMVMGVGWIYSSSSFVLSCECSTLIRILSGNKPYVIPFGFLH